jgi:hypothetical protein
LIAETHTVHHAAHSQDPAPHVEVPE